MTAFARDLTRSDASARQLHVMRPTALVAARFVRQSVWAPTRSQTMLTRLLLLLFIATIAPACAPLAPVASAIEAHEANLRDLRTNTDALLAITQPLATSMLDAEIEARRTAVLLELRALGRVGPSAFTAEDLDAVLRQEPWSSVTARLGVALAAARTDQTRDALTARHPVVAALITLQRSPAQVADDVSRVIEHRGRTAALRGELTDAYPHVARAVAERAAARSALDRLTDAIRRQHALAATHAALFTRAVHRETDTHAAVQGVSTDDALAALPEGRVRESARDAIELLRTLFTPPTTPDQ